MRFFSKFERLFKKNMYNSIIQSIAHLKLWLFPIFLWICEFHTEKTAPAWQPRMNQANFWYPVLMWTVFQWGRSASTGTNGSQKGQGLGYKAGGVKLPIHCFPNSSLTGIATWGRALSWWKIIASCLVGYSGRFSAIALFKWINYVR